jgi:hypothetical protein
MPNKDTRIIDNIRRQKEKLEELKADARLKEEKEMKSMHRAAKNEKKQHAHDEAWNRLKEASKELDEKGQNGYDTWVAAMSAILMHTKLIAAVNPIGSLVSGLAGVALTLIKRGTQKEGKPGKDWSLGAIIDNTISDLSNKGPAPVDLSDFELQHFVEFTDTHTLDIASLSKNLRRSDGVDFTPEQEEIFKDSLHEAMKLWLDNQGYQPDPATPPNTLATAFVLKTDHTQRLEKDVFEGLRDDETRGLNEFFSGRFDVTFGQASGPKPSPFNP